MKKTLILLFVCLSSIVYSQESTKANRHGFSVEGGIGIYTQRSQTAYGKALWVNLSNNNTLYKFKYQLIDNYITEAENLSFEQYTNNISILIGKKSGNHLVQVCASIGIGISNGIYQGNVIPRPAGIWWGKPQYKREEYNTVSFPLEFDFTIKPLNFLGLGFALTADINKERTNLGALFKCGLGVY